MRTMLRLLTLGAAVLAMPAAGQLSLPGVALPRVELPRVPVDRALGETTEAIADPGRLLDLRTERLERLVRRNREVLEFDARGAPALRGALLLLDPSPAALAA